MADEITAEEKEQVWVDYHLFEMIFKQVECQTEFTSPLSKQAAHMIAIVCEEMKNRLFDVYMGADSIDMLYEEEGGDLSWLYSDKMKEAYPKSDNPQSRKAMEGRLSRLLRTS